ncbi:MAG: hypothetical protein ABI345_00945 [Jatrophihabitans sp.]
MTAQADGSPRRVWVTGRQDVGEVIDPGKVIGHRPSLLCVGVHFPLTGEVVYFDASRVVDVDAPY